MIINILPGYEYIAFTALFSGDFKKSKIVFHNKMV
jgi:hypothetical protein